MKYRT